MDTSGFVEMSVKSIDTVLQLKGKIARRFDVATSQLQVEFGGMSHDEVATDEMQLFHRGVEDHALVIVRRHATIIFRWKENEIKICCMMDNPLQAILEQFAEEIKVDIICLHFVLTKWTGIADAEIRNWLPDSSTLFEADSPEGSVAANGLQDGDVITAYAQLIEKRKDRDIDYGGLAKRAKQNDCRGR